MFCILRYFSLVSKGQLIRRFLTPGGTDGRVAFYAYISKDFGHVGQNQVFLYDTIVTNYGNAYSQHTGAFTAPTTGIYAFCYTAYAAGKHVAGEGGNYGEVSVEILQNGIYIVQRLDSRRHWNIPWRWNDYGLCNSVMLCWRDRRVRGKVPTTVTPQGGGPFLDSR